MYFSDFHFIYLLLSVLNVLITYCQVNYKGNGLWWDHYDNGAFVKTQYGDIRGFRLL